ncbi:MAG TPA: rod shape-determining protein MreC [Methylophilaceae bacterium]|nr:rod shape-determining protein MreC [Methylophilaceae bacterium]HQR61043.1 rod shape-determining protein MreC [Methylophilaceae bacterium]
MDPYQPHAFFARGPSTLVRLIFFGTLSIVLMAVDSRLHTLTEVRQGIVALLHPLEVIVHSPVAAYHQVSEYLSTQNTLTRENRHLREQALRQGAELQRFHTLLEENEHLRNLLGVVPALAQPARLAEIVHAGRDPFTHKVIVNLGSQQGISSGQAAVDEYGVIGQVTRVYPFSSEVTLVTDKDLTIPVQIERNGLRAIAFGNGRERAINLPYLPANVDVREGDTLVTSGIDGIYPSGMAVAKVTRIERAADSPFAHIVCTPTAGTETHRQILLLAVAEKPPQLPPPLEQPNPSPARHASKP